MRTQDPRTKGLHCPSCGERNDDYSASNMNKRDRPNHGDLNICAYCLKMSTFENVEENLALVNMTQDQQDHLIRTHPEVEYAMGLARKKQPLMLLAREARKRMKHGSY